jgi:hypothetical protein
MVSSTFFYVLCYGQLTQLKYGICGSVGGGGERNIGRFQSLYEYKVNNLHGFTGSATNKTQK